MSRSRDIANLLGEGSVILDGAPSALDTLNELAAAIGNDANYASTVTTALSSKAPIDSPTFTGTVTVPTPSNSTDAATKNYVDSNSASIPFQGTSPLSPSFGDYWVDSTTATGVPTLKVYDGSSWIEVGSSVQADGDQIILSSRMFT